MRASLSSMKYLTLLLLKSTRALCRVSVFKSAYTSVFKCFFHTLSLYIFDSIPILDKDVWRTHICSCEVHYYFLMTTWFAWCPNSWLNVMKEEVIALQMRSVQQNGKRERLKFYHCCLHCVIKVKESNEVRVWDDSPCFCRLL